MSQTLLRPSFHPSEELREAPFSARRLTVVPGTQPLYGRAFRPRSCTPEPMEDLPALHALISVDEGCWAWPGEWGWPWEWWWLWEWWW